MPRSRQTPQQIAMLAFGRYLSLALILGISIHAVAQDSYKADRERAFQLFNQNNFVEAIPALEKLVAVKGNDIVVLERLGWSLFVVSASIKDPQKRQTMRDRAREVLTRAKDLGDDSELLQAGLKGLSAPDASEFRFSSVSKADEAMRDGEKAHTQGELDKAIKYYERALELDPKLYFAALWAGDMYFKKGYQATDPVVKKQMMTAAGEWFTRAINIDANIETAYRYWGDALMAIGDREAAKAKFIDAIIAQPYDRKPYVGLTQWANEFKVVMSHPEIRQPTPSMRSSSNQGQTTITLDPKALDPKQGPDYYWSFYDLTRATYKTASFQKDYPDETQYRHSLREEASALRVVAEIVSKDLAEGKIQNLNQSLENLLKLYKADLIEPYVLFVRPNAGIAHDYATYRQTNREKLRRYWLEFVVQTGPGSFH
jgi:tetratricopeptide (TPR) repeat protein